MSELSDTQSEDRSQATSFSLRLTEDRDVNVSSQAVKLKEHLFITEYYVNSTAFLAFLRRVVKDFHGPFRSRSQPSRSS